MATRSRDFVGVAEGIKSHEISTKGRIEQLKGRISELSSQKSSLNGRISYLESAIAAAYEDTDEDGEPDYALIASLESQMASAENELSQVEQDLDTTGGELAHSENELQGVLENKAQTLFEIQERARKTSSNMSLAGGMYGAYAGVGSSLQSSMQTSLSALSQAAGILGGSVDSGASGGGSGGGSGSSHGSGTGGHTNSDLSSSPLAAFSGGDAGSGMSSSAPSPSQFSSSQTEHSTPGTLPNFHSGQSTINAQKPLNFNSDQQANSYAISGFNKTESNDSNGNSQHSFSSEQQSSNIDASLKIGISTQDNVAHSSRISESFASDDGIESLFGIRKDRANTQSSSDREHNTGRSDLEKMRAWAEQYKVSVPNSNHSANGNNTTSSSATAIGQLQRELARETGMEIDDGFASVILGSFIIRNSKRANVSNSDSHNSLYVQSERERNREFKKQFEVDFTPAAPKKLKPSSGSGQESKGQRQREIAHTTGFEYDDGLLYALSSISILRDNASGQINQGEDREPVHIRNQQLVGKIDKSIAQNGWKAKKERFTLEEDLKAVNPQFYDSNNNITSDDRWTRNCQRCVVALEARFRGADVKAKARVLDGTDTLPIMAHPNGWLSVFKNPSPHNCKGTTGIDTGINVVKEMQKYGDGSRAIVRIQRCDTIKIKSSSGSINNYAIEVINGRTVVCDILSRQEVDISSSFPKNDFSDGVEIQRYRNPYNPSIIDTILVTKTDGKPVCTAQNNGGHVFSAIQKEGKTVFCDAQTGKIIEKPENYFFLAKREETYVVRTDNLEFTERAKDCCQ